MERYGLDRSLDGLYGLTMPRRKSPSVDGVAAELVTDGDGEVLYLVPNRRPSQIRLITLDDVRVEQSRQYRGMIGGQISTQDGAKILWSLSLIAKTITEAKVEVELARLEQQVAQLTGSYRGGST